MLSGRRRGAAARATRAEGVSRDWTWREDPEERARAISKARGVDSGAVTVMPSPADRFELSIAADLVRSGQELVAGGGDGGDGGRGGAQG